MTRDGHVAGLAAFCGLPPPNPNDVIPWESVTAMADGLIEYDIRLPPWRDQAACRWSDANFFPGRGETLATREAKAVCAGCPVQAECLEWALTNCEHHGIWGGKAERERRIMRRQLPRRPQSHLVQSMILRGRSRP